MTLEPASLTKVGLLKFYLPLDVFSCRCAAEVRGVGVLVPTVWVSCLDESVSGVRDAGMTRSEKSYVYFVLLLRVGNPWLLAILLYRCIHKVCIRMVTWTYLILGGSLARCRIRSGTRRQQRGMVWLKLRSPCYAQVLPVEMEFKMKEGPKTSYCYYFLWVM